jgi:ABC-type transport system involved in multi-copper enzyme maturation permease subunit
MIWFTWRQFRTQTWIAVGAVAVLAAVLFITGRTIADAYAAAGLETCQGDCGEAVSAFLLDLRNSGIENVYNITGVIIYVVAALIGIFWGAPLVARELETGTHRLAWNQSVTRTRWLAAKFGIAVVVAATAGLFSWALTLWASRVDAATGERINPLVYGARGVVPVGYAVFAFAVGVTAGMLIRRTIPAMAATLAVTVATFVAVPLWIRGSLVSATHVTRSLDASAVTGILIGRDDRRMTIIGGADDVPGWVLSNETLTSTGQPFTGPADPQACGENGGPGTCRAWIDSLGLQQDLTYHPVENFWPLQWAELGLVLGAAGLLAGFCFWWTTRRLV